MLKSDIHLNIKLMRIVGSDVAYLIFVILLSVTLSNFQTVGAPLDLPRPLQIFYFDLSRNFREAANPGWGAFAIVSFCIFGCVKFFYGLSFF